MHTRSDTNWKTSFVYQENLRQMDFFFLLFVAFIQSFIFYLMRLLLCQVGVVSLSLLQRNSTVYNIPFVVHTSIQSNKINQKCLAETFFTLACDYGQQSRKASRKKQIILHRCDSLSRGLLSKLPRIIILCALRGLL